MSLLPETLNDPVLIAIITILVALGVHYQRGLTYAEYMQLMRVKRRVFPLFDSMNPMGFESFVHEKDDTDEDSEYYDTTDLDFRELWDTLKEAGGSPHLISSLKRRADGGLSKLHFVWMHDGTQTEAYAFSDGAIYVHHETGVEDVKGHLSDGIEPGDPKGVLDEIEF